MNFVFQEIEELKKQLESRKQGLSSATLGNNVQEEIVERVVVKHIGVSEEKVRELEEKAEEEAQVNPSIRHLCVCVCIFLCLHVSICVCVCVGVYEYYNGSKQRAHVLVL